MFYSKRKKEHLPVVIENKGQLISALTHATAYFPTDSSAANVTLLKTMAMLFQLWVLSDRLIKWAAIYTQGINP